MSKNLALSDKDVSLIATQTGIDPDIIRAWHKGFFFLFSLLMNNNFIIIF
jgi:hypothetical protein